MMASCHLTLAQARRLISIAFDQARHARQEIAVAVVDAGGNLLAFERSELAFLGAISAAQAKAVTANAYRRTTAQMQQRLDGGKLAYLALSPALPMEGGVPVQIHNDFLGAIGISGAPSETDARLAEETAEIFLAEVADHAARAV